MPDAAALIPSAAIYTQRRKARHFTEAMIAGFPAAQMGCEPGQLDPSADLHILGGLQFGCHALMRQILSRRLDYVFWDRAYFGGGSQSDRLRLTFNGYQKIRVDADRSLARFEAFGGVLQPWRKSGSHLLLVPPGEAIQDLFCGRDWLASTLVALRQATDRPIRISHKGDPVPLADRLRDCHAVVTYTSNVAVEAICAGVPAITAWLAAAGPVSGGVEQAYRPDRIEQPPMPEREAWAASLAWGQFTTEEIRSGFARAVVLEGHA